MLSLTLHLFVTFPVKCKYISIVYCDKLQYFAKIDTPMDTELSLEAKVQQLIKQLFATMTLKEIEEAIKAQLDINIGNTQLSKIKNGRQHVIDQKKLPELVAVLEKIARSKNKLVVQDAVQEMPQLTGSYIGFYFNKGEEVLRPLLLNLSSTIVELITVRYHYKGDFRLVRNNLIINLNVDKGDIPVVFYINIDDLLSAKPGFHVDVLIAHYIFPLGKGMVSGTIAFFYAPDAWEEYQEKGDNIFTTSTHLADFQAKAERYFAKPQLIVTDDAIFSNQKFNKRFS